jgi:hypothetical protein
MRPLFVLLLSLVISRICAAQTPYPVAPATPMVQPSWGGYALPTQVPYQPTLDGAAVAAGTYDPNQTWQGYPGQSVAVPIGSQPVETGPMVPPGDAVYLDGAPPGVAHELPPGTPLYPGTTEPSLRESLTPPDARNGFFQKVRLAADVLPQFSDDSLGWTDFGVDVVTALPFFTRENPIIITPTYDIHFLDRPVGFELPPTLHDVAIDFHIFRVFGNHWIADFAVQPGLYGDSDSLDASEALRFTGRALGVYAPTIDVKYVLGVTYLDGGWAKVVPVAGVIYKPNDDLEYQLIFPTPRISWRLPGSAIPGKDERWMYVAVEYANQAWAFQQADGVTDVLAYRDYRVILGLERKVVGGLSRRFEIGYVFNRDMKIASVSGNDIGMGSTLIARVGVAY